MVSLTTPDNFVYPDDGDPFDPSAAFAALATSIQQWAIARQIPDYFWNNSTERDAEIGMTAGAEGYQADNQLTYKYNGTAWKVWHSLQPISYTPTWVNLTVGNSVQNFTYTVASGRVAVSGFITIGSTGTVGTAPYMSLPLPANGYITNAPVTGNRRVLGGCTLESAGVDSKLGSVITQSLSSVIYAAPVAITASGTYTTTTGMSALIPHTWKPTDFMTFDYAYMAD